MAKKIESTVTKRKAGKTPLPKDISPGREMRKFSWEFLRHLFYTQGRVLETATPNDLYMAAAHAVRRRGGHARTRVAEPVAGGERRSRGDVQ